MSSIISCATARIDDSAEMARFLAGIPNSAELAKLLQRREAMSSRAYDDGAWTARFVSSDGHAAKCFAVTGITIDQAEMIAAVCDDVGALEETQFREAVARSLGPTFDPAQ
jgi:hypothetical protein